MMQDCVLNFSARLRRLRENSGLSQTQLANELGVSRGSISFYENCDRTPDIMFLCRVSLYYGVSADWLLGLSDKKQNDISISEYTGLTESSIEAIRKLDKEALDGLNAFLSSLN